MSSDTTDDPVRLSRRSFASLAAMAASPAQIQGDAGDEGDDGIWPDISGWFAGDDDGTVHWIGPDGEEIAVDPGRIELEHFHAEQTEAGILLRPIGDGNSPWEYVDGELHAGESPIDAPAANIRGEVSAQEVVSPEVTAGQIHYSNTEDIQISVPSDYDTLRAAVEHLGARQIPDGQTVTINIESGHELQEGVPLYYTDNRGVEITSDDATVNVASDFTPVALGASDCVFALYRTFGPWIWATIDGSQYTDSTLTGLQAEVQSRAVVTGGITNCDYGVDLYDSSALYGESADFSGHSQWGVGAWNGCTAIAPSANITDCGVAAYVAHCSAMYASQADFSGATDGGVFVDASGFLDGFNATIDDSGGNGLEVHSGAVVTVQNASVTGNSDDDIAVITGGVVSAYDATTSNSSGSTPAAQDINVKPNTVTASGVVFSNGSPNGDELSRAFVDSSSTTTYTTTPADEVVGVDSSSDSVTVTIDSASASEEGNTVEINDEGGSASTNSITVETEGTESVDGGSSITITSDYGSAKVYSDGDNLFTL